MESKTDIALIKKDMEDCNKPIKKNFIYYLKFFKDYAIPLAAILFSIVSGYTAYKLNPIISEMEGIITRVDAVEHVVDRNNITINTSLKDAIKERNDRLDKMVDTMTTINVRLSRIEGKLEK